MSSKRAFFNGQKIVERDKALQILVI